MKIYMGKNKMPCVIKGFNPAIVQMELKLHFISVSCEVFDMVIQSQFLSDRLICFLFGPGNEIDIHIFIEIQGKRSVFQFDIRNGSSPQFTAQDIPGTYLHTYLGNK